jgi:hypothetical protein
MTLPLYPGLANEDAARIAGIALESLLDGDVVNEEQLRDI